MIDKIRVVLRPFQTPPGLEVKTALRGAARRRVFRQGRSVPGPAVSTSASSPSLTSPQQRRRESCRALAQIAGEPVAISPRATARVGHPPMVANGRGNRSAPGVPQDRTAPGASARGPSDDLFSGPARSPPLPFRPPYTPSRSRAAYHHEPMTEYGTRNIRPPGNGIQGIFANMSKRLWSPWIASDRIRPKVCEPVTPWPE
ncbi:hypothetical protein SDC9_36078 [bioreactor metagenome]|uniref:Uncharacterized protein n=1 Tax=bioreactor metagenome TaxID=1076179 RepID=A0A644VHD5_9ZZZZ